jgi:hypothetical protein
MSRIDDWLSRVNVPDVYPRRDDPFKPAAGTVPEGAPAASMLSAEDLVVASVWDGWLTSPSTRPVVYQQCLNFNITANVVPVPITNGAFQCDAMILDVLSTAANSVFFGFGNGITATSGIEIRPGLPVVIEASNTREQWEIQRLLEMIAGMIAAERGYNPPGEYRAPRVVFDASDYFVVATTATTVRVMLFMSPQFQ